MLRQPVRFQVDGRQVRRALREPPVEFGSQAGRVELAPRPVDDDIVEHVVMQPRRAHGVIDADQSQVLERLAQAPGYRDTARRVVALGKAGDVNRGHAGLRCAASKGTTSLPFSALSYCQVR